LRLHALVVFSKYITTQSRIRLKIALAFCPFCFVSMIGQASRWTRQARASAPETSILSIPDVEWFNCGYALRRFTMIES
jgi:hypothetical protein